MEGAEGLRGGELPDGAPEGSQGGGVHGSCREARRQLLVDCWGQAFFQGAHLFSPGVIMLDVWDGLVKPDAQTSSGCKMFS
jgi:hypothetical protein